MPSPDRATIAPPAAQTLTIPDWHPQTNANKRATHWAVTRARKASDEEIVWFAAKQAGWRFVPGRVRLTIELVYPQRYTTDTDNAYARVKGVVDVLKTSKRIEKVGRLKVEVEHRGFFTDDSRDWCDLHVETAFEPGTKTTRITLEPACLCDPPGSGEEFCNGACGA